MRQVIGAALAVLLSLSGCSQPEPKAVSPALWEVTGPKGEHGWLFGTIHALPEPVKWRSPKLDAALQGSNLLVLEIGNAGDPAAIGIRDIGKPDFGDAVEIRAGELPVFWACGVTPQAAVMQARPPFAITHKPGHMFLTDVRDVDLDGE